MVGLLAGAVIVAAVLAGNALTYHDTRWPRTRGFATSQQIGERFAGQGPTLTPDFDEYAEYYLRDDDQDSMVNGPGSELRPGVNRETEPGGIFAYDLDEYPLAFVERFRTIVMRRNPLASRPPSNYRLVYARPTTRSGSASSRRERRLRARAAAGTTRHSQRRRLCRDGGRGARKAGPRAQIAYMPSPTGYLQVDGSNMTLSSRYAPVGRHDRGDAAPGAPYASSRFPWRAATNSSSRAPSAARWTYVDGRHVATAAYQESYPDEWI